eukprot:6041676-Amphidinium_carterae.1
MNRVLSLGLPARIVRSLFSVGLYGAEVGEMSASHMNDVRISAHKALGKGANLRRSSPLELMAYGGLLEIRRTERVGTRAGQRPRQRTNPTPQTSCRPAWVDALAWRVALRRT